MFQNSLVLVATIVVFVMTVMQSIINHNDIFDSVINVLISFGLEFVIFYIVDSGMVALGLI